MIDPLVLFVALTWGSPLIAAMLVATIKARPSRKIYVWIVPPIWILMQDWFEDGAVKERGTAAVLLLIGFPAVAMFYFFGQ